MKNKSGGVAGIGLLSPYRSNVINPQVNKLADNDCVAGFTLLELLIALSLSTVILTVLMAGGSLILKDWQRQENKLDSGIDKALFFVQLERSLEGAYPYLYRDDDGTNRFKKHIYFEGEKDELRWVTSISPNRRGGLFAWRMAVDKEGSTQVWQTPLFADNPDTRLEEGTPVMVLKNLIATVQFLGKQVNAGADDASLVWFDTWSARKRNSLPLAVRLILAESDGDNTISATTTIFAPISANENIFLHPSLF